EELALVFLAGEHELGWQDAVLETPLLLVDVEDEEVQRCDALNEAGLDPLPLSRGDDPGDEVEGEDALGPLLLTIHRERDALIHERELLQALAALDLTLGEGLEDRDEWTIVRTRATVAGKRFVECLRFGQPFHGAQE